ncbi:spore germination protein [Paenisporosarcina sp. TG-14]|uniref:spore germination protein n=1 Tax=Paenisporosarcina sp. TG-14 TaxID=1231057 RepID=UPI000474E1FF
MEYLKIFNRTQKKVKSNSTNLINSNRDLGQKGSLKMDLQENIRQIKESFGNSPDLVIREISIGKQVNIPAAVIYTEGLADSKSVNHFIMESLMKDIWESKHDSPRFTNQNILRLLKESVLTVGDIKDVSDFATLLTSILSGNTAILIDGHAQGFLVGLKGSEDRGVQEPTTQTVVRGPKEGFTENIRTNTSLIRRKIKDPNLWLENLQIGKVTQTDVSIMYIQGIANEKMIEEVRIRLKRIQIDGILESAYIEELIQDETYTVFPTVFNTERPDVIAAGLLEGRCAIIIDGTPFVLLVPVTFTQFLTAADDYYQRADIGTALRVLRYFAVFIALLGPSIFIAITTFHHSMIPPQLIISLMAQRENVPFPAFIEALIMEITFEILREAGVRMPKAIGQAVSIVGALVIGQAAVDAGWVSAAMVIVVSITAIANFTIPSYNLGFSVRILRFGLMLLAASFGLVGVVVGLIGITQHMIKLRSFGVPYMSPFGPVVKEDQKDAILRVPWWGMHTRPRFISQKNIIREDNASTKKPEE